jgi:hypothetical protein
MAAMSIANSRVVSLDRGNVQSNDMLVIPVVDARNVPNRANGSRRSFRVLVLARVVKSKSGFAQDESLSMANLRFSAFAWGRRIMCVSTDA